MRSSLATRLDTVATQVAALTGGPGGGSTGPQLWRLMLLLTAVHEGQMGRLDSVMMGLQRALGYERMADLEAALETDLDEFNSRYVPAKERMFERHGLTPEVMARDPTAFAAVLQTLIAGVPSQFLTAFGFGDLSTA
jgi:hypothetical protein